MNRHDVEVWDGATYRSAASAFFFVLALFGRSQARGGPECFAEVVQRKVTNVERNRARRSLFFEDDRDRTAFDTITEPDAATAGESGVRKTFEHGQI
jgi:hypothetical protein